MKNVHKIVKYLALGFAFFIICNIVSLIMHGIISLSNIFAEDKENSDLKILNIQEKINILDIELESANIIFKIDNNFSVSYNDYYLNVEKNKDKLVVDERKINLFRETKDNDLIISIPSYYIFELVSLDTGAGLVNIDSLSSKKLELDLGAGNVEINNLNILTKADIDSGAGKVNIRNSTVNNLDLDLGIGKVKIESNVFGDSEIDCGIGNLDITLLGNKDNYKINANKGIGNFTISGDNVKNNTYYGNGSNSIIINGGIGNITVNFKN